MKGIKCKSCKNLVDDWCDVKCDSPDPALVRDCIGFEQFTNGDRIRAMTDEELAKFIFSLADGENDHDVACFGCINYDTHHSDPAYKCAGLYECEGCPNEGIGLDVEKWLKQPVEKS